LEVLRVTREPIFNVPSVVLGLIGTMIALHVALNWLDNETASEAIMAFGFVPADLSERLFGGILHPIIDLAASKPDDEMLAGNAELAEYLITAPSVLPFSFVSYAFLHASWPHVLMNGGWLLAFGSLVARRLGTVRFLLLFLGSAIGGAFAHYVGHSSDVMPVIGASAAVSGMMAAAIRFVFQPGESLSGFSMNDAGTYRAPALPLQQTFRDRRTLRFILLWLAINIATGLAGVPLGLVEGSIAWEAHLGGFMTGLILFSFLDPPMDLHGSSVA
jgi:membrane associated rhomboid family serine protease